MPVSSSVTDVSPKVSRTRSSSAGSAVSPRSTLPASVPRVSASAVARAACRVRRAARSTTELTSSRDHDEDHQGERRCSSRDGERVQRRREVVVEQQRTRRRRRPGPARNPPTSATTTTTSRNSSMSLTRFRCCRSGDQQPAVSSGGSSTAERRSPAAGGGRVRPPWSRGQAEPLPICCVGDDVDVDVAGVRGSMSAPMPGPVRTARQPAAAAGAEHELGGVLRAGEVQQGVRHVVADDLVVGAAERLDQPPLRGQVRRARRRRARRTAATWTASRSPPVDRAAIRAARRISVSPSGPPVSATTTRSRASQVPLDVVLRRGSCCSASSTRSAIQSRASSRSAVRLPTRK